MKKNSSMIKDSIDISESHFGCYFRCSLCQLIQKLNSSLEHMGYVWFVKKSVVFDSEHIKNDS